MLKNPLEYFIAPVLVIAAVVVAPQANAETPLYLLCTETIYDQHGSNPFEIEHTFVLKSSLMGLGRTTMRWVRKDIDFEVQPENETRIVATARMEEIMPRPGGRHRRLRRKGDHRQPSAYQRRPRQHLHHPVVQQSGCPNARASAY